MANAFDSTAAPVTEPIEIVQGDFVQWRRADLGNDYPPADYVLSYSGRREGEPARKVEVSASASGGDYLVSLPSATTAQWEAGSYHWDAYITRNSDGARITIGSGVWTVVPDKASSSDDPRGLALKMLAYIEAALLHRAENHQLDVLAYTMGVETSATRNPEKLLMWRDYWKREIARINRRERIKKGQSPGNIIRTRF